MQVEKWAEGVKDLAKCSKRHPQMTYASLGMLLQLKRQYLQRNISGVVTLMKSIELDLREYFFPALFVGQDVDDDLKELLIHDVKQDGIGILDSRNLAEWGHATPVEVCEALAKSLLGGDYLNHIGHQSCVRKARER